MASKLSASGPLSPFGRSRMSTSYKVPTAVDGPDPGGAGDMLEEAGEDGDGEGGPVPGSVDAEPTDSISTDGAPSSAEVTAPTVDSGAGATIAAGDAAAVERLLAQISIRPLPDGRLAVEASPAAASAMATMLRGLAALLESQAR